jgi:hypothetical protein
MTHHTTDQSVLQHIEMWVEQERGLQHKEALSEEDRARLHAIEGQLDQCWDLLRRRRALRRAGDDPDKADLRPRDTVEHYEQ